MFTEQTQKDRLLQIITTVTECHCVERHGEACDLCKRMADAIIANGWHVVLPRENSIIDELHNIVKNFAASVGCNNLCAGKGDKNDQCENCNRMVDDLYVFFSDQANREIRNLFHEADRSAGLWLAEYARRYYFIHQYDRVPDGNAIRPINAEELFDGLRRTILDKFIDKK